MLHLFMINPGVDFTDPARTWSPCTSALQPWLGQPEILRPCQSLLLYNQDMSVRQILCQCVLHHCNHKTSSLVGQLLYNQDIYVRPILYQCVFRHCKHGSANLKYYALVIGQPLAYMSSLLEGDNKIAKSYPLTYLKLFSNCELNKFSCNGDLNKQTKNTFYKKIFKNVINISWYLMKIK